EDPPIATMTDNRTMAEMLRAPTEGYAEAIVVSPILAEQFELKHSLINMNTFYNALNPTDQDSLNAAAGVNEQTSAVTVLPAEVLIIAKELGEEEKAALIKVLKYHPEFCTHEILMEEDYKPTVQHQRRVNPK
nr:reverse transcriptase domain-containing protein [Tanacetum cinerariifolium]